MSLGQGRRTVVEGAQVTIQAPLDVTMERERAELAARQELLSMEEDPVARATRHVKAEQTAKTVELLQLDLVAKEKKIRELEEKLRRRSTTLTRKLETNTRWTQVCAVLVLMALVGPTDKLAAMVSWVLDYFAKRAQQRPGG